jgi:hypothetical protein
LSTQTEITRLRNARDKLRDKGVALGITVSTAKLETIASAFDGIANQGTVTKEVKEGEVFTIPKGYHNGAGTVTGVKGGGSYTLQYGVEATPTKEEQSFTPAAGHYGIGSLIVKPIPDNYQDVSPVDATAADVLANRIFVDKEGTPTAGTIPIIGAVNAPIDGLSTTGYTIPKGYHSGSGTVSLTDDIETALAAI